MNKSNDNPDIIFGEIYDKYCRSALEVAFNVLNDLDLAQDACQLAFAYIAQHLSKATSRPDKTKNYVLKVTHHFAIDIYRKNQSIRLHEIPLIDNEENEDEGIKRSIKNTTIFSVESFENALLDKYDLIELWASLEKMDDKNLAYIQEYYFEDMTFEKIANKHGISKEAAKKRVYRSVAKLKKIFLRRMGNA